MLKTINKIEFKKIYFYFVFNKLPFNDRFFFRRFFVIPTFFLKSNIFLHNGILWFRFKVTKWRLGLSLNMFVWTKKIAIFKKKKKK